MYEDENSEERFEEDPVEPPEGGLTAPWEEGDTADSTESDPTASSPADTSSNESDSGDSTVSTIDRLIYVGPRVLALVLFVGLPATIVYALMVRYFRLEPLYRVIALLGIALFVRWALKPHLRKFFTHPAERD